MKKAYTICIQKQRHVRSTHTHTETTMENGNEMG